MINIAIYSADYGEIAQIQELLEGYLQQAEAAYKIDSYTSSEELLYRSGGYDVIFFTILSLQQIEEDINGGAAEEAEEDVIQLGRRLRCFQNSILIYISDCPEAWRRVINQTHAFAFLEKPLTCEQLGEQLKDVLEKKRWEALGDCVGFEVLAIQGTAVKKELKEIPVRNIYYFEFVNRRIRIRLREEEFYFVGKLADVEEKMEKYGFVRCHHAYIANIHHIVRIEKNIAYFDNGEQLPVSQRKSAAFRKKVSLLMHKI